MALIIKDRVKEITTTTGTGDVSLGGASATFDAFQSVMSNGDTTFYAIVHTASGTDEWEVGVGTWNTGNTLTRTTVYAGSNGTSAVNFSSGNKDIFMTYPASKAAVAGEDVTFADITATDITSTGTVTLSADPSSALQAATKQYVDTIAAAGIHYHAPVRVEHPSNLNATYNNGSSGVGATLTNAGTNAALVLDNVSMVLNDRVLVANQTDQTQNGVYTVTTVGDGSTAWVLTRSTDTDSYAPSDGDSLGEGDAFFIKEGDTNAGHLDVMTTSGTITFGTTNIVFSEVAETSIYSAGTGLTLTGTTFSTNQDISTSASPTFNNITVTGTVDGRDVATDGSKLDGIEAGATADQTAAEIKTAYESNSNTNAFTDAEKTKLSGIETGATGDQTASEILTAIKTVDGAASGLDADLLDGQQGSYYLNTSTTFSGDVSGTYNNIVVANDSHTHDGRYYTETEADSRFLRGNTSDTLSGDLTVTGSVQTEGPDGGITLRTWTGGSGYGGLATVNQSGNEYIVLSDGDNTFISGGSASGGVYIRGGNNGAGGSGDLVVPYSGNPTFAGNTIFHDGYHPNADKWTTARTLSLSGDASGSVSWDGSANATLSVTVANDSHSHSNYITSNADDSMSGKLTFTDSDADFIEYNGSSTAPYFRFKTSGTNNGYIQFESNGNSYFWNDRVSQGIKVATGTSGLQWYTGGAYRTIWHSANDGSGSGLDADLLDGYQLSTTRNAASTVPVRDGNGYLQLGWINTTSGATTSTINKIYASYDDYVRYVTPATLISQLNLSTTSHNHTYNVNDPWLRDNGDNAHVKLYGNSRQMVFRTDGTTEYASGVGGYPFAWMYGGDASSNRRMLLSSVGDLWTSTNGWLSTALSGKLSTTGKAADSNLLDGIDSGSFVRSDADDTVSGHTEWQDSKEVRFGNDADFRIFHNGTHAYLRNYNHSQGNIYIQGENTSGTNQNLFVGVTNVARGYVSLYEDNTERLRTLSGGVGVTGLSVGDVDANPANSNGLTVANGGDEKIVLRNSSNPYISFQEATTTKAYMQWNSGGFLLFRHKESGSGRFTFRPNATTDSVDIRLEASDGDRYGSVYGTHNNEIGFLDQDGSWAYRHATDSLHEWRINNTVEMDLDSSGLDLKGNNLEGATDIYVADQIIHTGDTDTYMQFNAANTWRVVTGNTEGLKVSGVNVDLGIVGKIRHGGNTSTYMQFHNTDQWRVVVGNTERLEVKNSSPHVLVTGDLNSTSDERLKKNVTPITNALSDVIQLEGVSFDWKDTGTRGHGFIAQQVEPILPDVVQTDEETGIKSINYVGMIGHLVEAIKEQQEQIEELKRRIGE